MRSRISLGLKFLNYWLWASSGKGHGIHSAFVFQFIQNVLNSRQNFHAHNKIEKLRQELLKDHTPLKIQDLGAGSVANSLSQRTISSIVRSAAKPKKYGQLLFRMVHYFQPRTILELGTSLGISTAYMAAANQNAKVVTIEGAAEVAAIAKKNFETLQLQNIELVTGNFDDTLPSVISQLPGIDLAFIDGNHRQEATERYFNIMLEKIHNDSILVFDDIHWSAEMDDAWKTIQSHPSVRCTLDIFFDGIVFFRKEFKEKQHFVIRF